MSALTNISIDNILATQGYDTADKRIALFEQIAKHLLTSKSGVPTTVCIVGPAQTGKSVFARMIVEVAEKLGVHFASHHSIELETLPSDKKLMCCTNTDIRSVPPHLKQKPSDVSVDSFFYLTNETKIASEIDEWYANWGASSNFLRIDFAVPVHTRLPIPDRAATHEMWTTFKRVSTSMNTPSDTAFEGDSSTDAKVSGVNTILATQGYDTADKRLELYKKICDTLLGVHSKGNSPSVVCILGPSGNGKSKFVESIVATLGAANIKTEYLSATPSSDDVQVVPDRSIVGFKQDVRRGLGAISTRYKSLLISSNDSDAISEMNVDNYLIINFPFIPTKMVIMDYHPTAEMLAAFGVA